MNQSFFWFLVGVWNLVSGTLMFCKGSVWVKELEPSDPKCFLAIVATVSGLFLAAIGAISVGVSFYEAIHRYAETLPK